MRGLLRGRGEMLVALLVMGSGLVVAGVTAPSAPGAQLTAVTTTVSNTWSSGPASVEEPVRFHLVTSHSSWRAPSRRADTMTASPAGPLLLLLPAAGRAAEDYQRFLTTATAAGYHVLALGSGSPGRLRPTLARLAEDDSAAGWDRYLDEGAVRWNRIVLAGHGKGGAQALAIAEDRPVRGVLLLDPAADPLAPTTLSTHRAVRVADTGLLDDGGAQAEAAGYPDWQRALIRFR